MSSLIIIDGIEILTNGNDKPSSVMTALVDGDEVEQVNDDARQNYVWWFSHLFALFKTLQDSGLYFNSSSQLDERYDPFISSPPWQNMGNGCNVFYVLVCALFTAALATSTQWAFARFVRKNFFKARTERGAGGVEKGFAAATALFKAIVKTSSVGLQVYNIATQGKSKEQRLYDFSGDMVVPGIFMVIIVVGVFTTELARLIPEPKRAKLKESGNSCCRLLFYYYCAACAGLGSALTYYTSFDGYWDHTRYIKDNLSNNLDKGWAACLFVLNALGAAFLSVSESRVAAYNVGVRLFKDNRVYNWRESYKPGNTFRRFWTPVELKISGAYKSIVSASSFAAAVFTLVVAGKKEVPEQRLSVAKGVNFALWVVFSIGGYIAQKAGLTPNHVKIEKDDAEQASKKCCTLV